MYNNQSGIDFCSFEFNLWKSKKKNFNISKWLWKYEQKNKN